MIKRFFIYGCIGICLEVIWTGIFAFFRGEAAFIGHSSPIMLPVYGAAVFLEPMFIQLKNRGFLFRGIMYMSLIFAAEYFSGLLLRSFNICPWEYFNAPLNIKGIIRLDYAPLWFAVGLMYEFLYKKLDSNTFVQR